MQTQSGSYFKPSFLGIPSQGNHMNFTRVKTHVVTCVIGGLAWVSNVNSKVSNWNWHWFDMGICAWDSHVVPKVSHVIP